MIRVCSTKMSFLSRPFGLLSFMLIFPSRRLEHVVDILRSSYAVEEVTGLVSWEA